MMRVHDLQKSLHMGLLLSDCEIVNGEVVLVRLNFNLFFTILSNAGLLSIIEASQHLQTTELAMAPKKAEIVSHLRGAAIGALKKAFLVTRPKQIGAKIPITVHVAVGKVILWNLNKGDTHFSYWYSI
jgi:hypothetical protein